MNAPRKRRAWAVALAFLTVICAPIGLLLYHDQKLQNITSMASELPAMDTTTVVEVTKADKGAALSSPAIESALQRGDLSNPQFLVERHKEVDRQHMRQLHTGLFEYKKIHGHFPERLSQLMPDFVSADVLESPRNDKDGQNQNLEDHPDPGKKKPGYGFEFSNVVFRDGRTFEEIKEVQRAEWGDAVPILRAFGYEKIINMSYGGDLYETALNWEWDPATLDVTKARGWGPGLSEGEFTQVRVLGTDGRPIAGARVWADGRNYSFDLPYRPFLTDENGVARIPLGTDLNRTTLAVQAEGDRMISPVVSFPAGQPPQSCDVTAGPVQTVGGRVTDENGNALANTWLYLKGQANAEGSAMTGANLGTVKTDAFGQWTANLHPNDANAFNIAVGAGKVIARFSPGQPVDAETAATRNAVTIIPTK